MPSSVYEKAAFEACIRLFFIAFVFFLVGCGVVVTEHGRGNTYHTVKKGETLWRISRNYGVSLRDIADANNIKNTTGIEVGTRLRIPTVNYKKTTKAAKAPVHRTSIEREEREKRLAPEKEKRIFLWPVKGEVSSKFGMRDGKRHAGIDIRAPLGTPVKAADEGRVAFVSDSMRGYGNIIILKHPGSYYTVYAHNKQNLVREGANVQKGQTIASVGASGNATGNHLHFEVRRGKITLDPLFYLP